MAQPSTSDKQALPNKLLGLVGEARWLLFATIGLYLILILIGFDRTDPSWSHSASNAITHNPGGVFGAWLSDLLLYVFGVSSWWWVVLLLTRIRLSFFDSRERADSVFQPRGLWTLLLGFTSLLLASCSLEYLRLHTWQVTLPLVPGGMLGELLGDALGHAFGFIGATIFLLVLMTVGFSLFTGLSWLRFIVWLGASLETSYAWVRNAWQTRQDKKLAHKRCPLERLWWKKKRSESKIISRFILSHR